MTDNADTRNGADMNDIMTIISPGTILLGYRGSVAHGTFRPSTEPNSIDDIDYMGVVIPEPKVFLGLETWGNHQTRECFVGEIDLCEYEIRKFISLLLKCNPNVHMMLFLKPEHYLFLSAAGKRILESREIFATKAAYESYCGYARGQLHKMQALAFQGYMGEKRKELVRKFGYDTKNASHCIRLLRMGIEYLATGHMQIDRTEIDAKELLSIKDGAWSVDRVVQESSRLFAQAKEAFEASPLPALPDRDAANKLCVDIVREAMIEHYSPAEEREP